MPIDASRCSVNTSSGHLPATSRLRFFLLFNGRQLVRFTLQTIQFFGFLSPKRSFIQKLGLQVHFKWNVPEMGPPNHPFLARFSIINHPTIGVPLL